MNDPDEKRWLNSLGRDDRFPTMSTVVITHTDEIARKEIFKLLIRHVKSPHGNGFMCCVWSEGSSGNGKVHLGEGQKAYDEALAEGQAMLDEMVKELHDYPAKPGKERATHGPAEGASH